MEYKKLGFKSYREYLASNHFESMVAIAWKHSQKHCSVCRQRYNLQAHHLTYHNLGKRKEWRDLRFLCPKHHHRCHFALWIFPIKKNWLHLHLRYYSVKISYFFLHFPIWGIKFLVSNYSLGEYRPELTEKRGKI